jgi:hypothetical protein
LIHFRNLLIDCRNTKNINSRNGEDKEENDEHEYIVAVSFDKER